MIKPLNQIQKSILDNYNVRYHWAITLTYRASVESVDKVVKDIKRLMNYMRKTVVGQHRIKYFNQQQHIMMVGGIERHSDNSIHIHLNLKKPPTSIVKDDMLPGFTNSLHKDVLKFWQQDEKHSLKMTDNRKTNDFKHLLSTSDSKETLKYATKHTAKNNSNFFIAYWDSIDCVLPVDCLR